MSGVVSLTMGNATFPLGNSLSANAYCFCDKFFLSYIFGAYILQKSAYQKNNKIDKGSEKRDTDYHVLLSCDGISIA